MNIKHICTIATNLEEKTSKHVVKIDGDIYIFEFHLGGRIKTIYNQSEYFFSGCKHFSEIKQEDIDNRNHLALGSWDYFSSLRYEDREYENIFILSNTATWLVKELDDLKTNIKKLIS